MGNVMLLHDDGSILLLLARHNSHFVSEELHLFLARDIQEVQLIFGPAVSPSGDIV
jgi:hypothetical protein